MYPASSEAKNRAAFAISSTVPKRFKGMEDAIWGGWPIDKIVAILRCPIHAVSSHEWHSRKARTVPAASIPLYYFSLFIQEDRLAGKIYEEHLHLAS